MNVGTLTISLAARTAGLTAASARVKLFKKETLTTAQKVNRSISSIGMSMSALTIPIAAVGGAAVKLFSDFEFSLAKVVGLVGIAEEKVQAWGTEILKLGPEVAKGPKELGEALYYITSAGIRGTETMEVLEMSAKAAAAGLGETAVVADAVTSAMNAYGKDALSAAQATDILVMSIREGKVEPSDFAAAIGKALPIAAQLGVTFNDVGAAMAAMTRTGTKASTSAIYLRRVLSSILNPSKEAKVAVADLGESFYGFRQTLQEEGGLLKVLLKVRSLVDQFGEEEVSNIFPNLRAIIPVLDIIGKNLENNKVLWESISNPVGAARRAFEAVSTTFKHKWNSAVSSVETSFVKFGKSVAQTLIPVMEKVANYVEGLANKWESLDSATQNSIVKITLITAAVGPLAIIISTLINTALIPLRIALAALQIPIGILTGLGLSATIASWVLAFLAAAGAIAYMKMNFESLNSTIDAAGNKQDSKFKTWVNSVITKLETFVNKGDLNRFASQLEQATSIWDTFTQKHLSGTQMAEDLARLGGEVSDLTEKLAKLPKTVAASDMREEAYSNIVSKLKEMYDIRKKIISDAEKVGRSMGRMATANEDILEFAKKVVSGVVDAGLYDEARDASSEFSSFYEGFMTDLKKTGGDVFNWISDQAKKLAPALNSIVDFFSISGGKAAKVFTATFDDYFKKQQFDLIEQIVIGGGNTNFMNDLWKGTTPKQIAPTSQFTDISGPLSKMSNQLINLNKQFLIFGDASNYASERVRILTEFLDTAKERGIGGIFSEEDLNLIKETTDELKRIQNIWNTLQQFEGYVSDDTLKASIEYYTALGLTKRELEGIGGIITDLKGFNLFSDETLLNMMDGIASLKLTAGALRGITILVPIFADVFAGIGESIGKMAAGAGDAFDGLLNIIVGVFKQIGKLLISAGTILAIIPGFQALGIGLLLGGIGLSAMGAYSQETFASNATGMKDGGIIPAGFEGDKFPAMLNSGEAVIPLSKLPQLMGIGKTDKQEVFLRLKGRTAEALIGRQQTYNKAF